MVRRMSGEVTADNAVTGEMAHGCGVNSSSRGWQRIRPTDRNKEGKTLWLLGNDGLELIQQAGLF